MKKTISIFLFCIISLSFLFSSKAVYKTVLSNGEKVDEAGNMIHTFPDENGNETWYQYDEECNLVYTKSIREDSGIDECYYSYQDGKKVYASWNEGTVEEFFDYNTLGLLSHHKKILNHDMNNVYEENWYEYDSAGNVIKEKTYMLGTTWEKSYNTEGDIIYNSHNGYKYEYQYDEYGRIVEKTILYPKGSKREITYHYDNLNNLIAVKEIQNGEIFEFNYSYNSHGDMIYVSSSYGEVWNELEYWENGKIKKSVGYTDVYRSTTKNDSFMKIENLYDEFGDKTNNTIVSFSKNLNGSYTNTLGKGELEWNIHISPQNGFTYFRLYEDKIDKDVSTSSSSGIYGTVNKDTIYKVSFKDEDGIITTLYAKLFKSDSYKYNCLLLYSEAGILFSDKQEYPLDCRVFFSENMTLKVVISSEFGTYSLGTLDLYDYNSLI